MKLEKFNKALKIFIVVLTVILLVAIVILLLPTAIKEKEKPIKQHECIKLGKFCSEEEIYNGVEVEVEVAENKTERFHVISNTSYSMTLMLNENIAKKVDWHSDLFNIYGPDDPLIELANRTKTWKKIDKIKDYKYLDNGYATYVSNCQNQTTEPGYDCTNQAHPTRGYVGLRITNGTLFITTNFVTGQNEYETAYNLRARLITVEEIDALRYKQKLPKWLINDLSKKEGYWTLSSSTSKKSNYSQGAIAIANIDKEPSIESIFVMNNYNQNYKIGIRPVITIDKISSPDAH